MINNGYYSGISSKQELPDGRELITHYPILGPQSLEVRDKKMSTTEDDVKLEHDFNEAVEKMIAEYFPPEMMMWLDEPIQERIRKAMRDAYWNGTVFTIRKIFAEQLEAKQRSRAVATPMTAVSKAIEEDATEFEKLKAPKVLKREVNTAYPWGWCYASPRFQQEFREFCRSRGKKA